MEWDFTEYYYEGTTTPNNYYELQNTYNGKYIAPRIGADSVLSDSKIGINLNGRRYGDYYSTILAWDDAHYDYAGVRADGNTKVVSYPMAGATEFYFAILDAPAPELTEVDTIANSTVGLTMRMVNFTDPAGQNAFLGNSSYVQSAATTGLLSTDLGNDGYPTNAGGVSLATLFGPGSAPADHLFIESIYRGSGYCEYDSTRNFASLQSGEFKVYKELGTIELQHGGHTLEHGQFMPFNDLDPEVFSEINPENLYDVHANLLPDTDPRKGEKLYGILDPDYYFGMEIWGGFMQTPSGKDAWGHDIIFEFTGDDDFWLYVDGELVLDLGGIHRALAGSVNYSTGAVNVNGRKTTLRDVFASNYRARGMSESDIASKLDTIFTTKTVNGKTVNPFKDYSTHNVRIFFMERGAGASNLRMRFNLATVTPGKVQLTKEITGTDNTDYISAEFPFQVFYREDGAADFTRAVPGEDGFAANYLNTTEPVKFEASRTVDSISYPDVFLVKPGEIAELDFRGTAAASYKIVECGVRTNIYDETLVNEESPAVTHQDAEQLKSYESTETEIAERAKIVFSNHVDPAGLRTLKITKLLFDETILSDENAEPVSAEDDSTGFRLRIRVGEVNPDTGVPPYYAFKPYQVKDPAGNYCRYDPDRGFVSIGKNDYSALTDEERIKVNFHSSQNGAIDKIPSGYTIEIRELPVGIPFHVEEQNSDIPKGYRLLGYERREGSFLPIDNRNNFGTVRDNNDPQIEVRNLRGWGLTAQKSWSDENFMSGYGDIYFGVYCDGALVPDTLHKVVNGSVYYYFDTLLAFKSFADYEVREVVVTDPVTDADGKVTSFSDAAPIDDGGLLTVSATPRGGTPETLEYRVSYRTGEPTGNATPKNVRTDTVVNTRRDGVFIEVDGNGVPLAGATFTIKRGDTVIGAPTYTSQSDGLLTYLYDLESGEYTLTQLTAPSGWRGLREPIVLTVDGSGNITTSDDDAAPFTPASTPTDEAKITVKNKAYTLMAKKVDAEAPDTPLAEALFSLYRQVKDKNGSLRRDYYPIDGFRDVASGSDGRIPGVDQSLAPGGYYLVETEAPDGFLPYGEDIQFTISPLGYVSCDHAALLSETADTDGVIRCVLTVPNAHDDQTPITPTGVSLRVAPYALMLAFGAALTALGILPRVRKKRKERAA